MPLRRNLLRQSFSDARRGEIPLLDSIFKQADLRKSLKNSRLPQFYCSYFATKVFITLCLNKSFKKQFVLPEDKIFFSNLGQFLYLQGDSHLQWHEFHKVHQIIEFSLISTLSVISRVSEQSDFFSELSSNK